MEMTTVKTFAVMAVIFGCFAILYPKIFHPIVLSALGISSPSTQTADTGSRLPQHLKKPEMGTVRPTGSSGAHDDIARHMRAGPHPGMRAAAEMQKQANTQNTGGKGGMMTVVLPMYAVGIVVYLIYTLSKVFGRKKKSADDEYVKRHFNRKQPLNEVRYDSDRKKFMYGDEESEEETMNHVQRSRKQQRDLERLLFKADREKISDIEMHELKRRLLETESQMTRILQAMETVQDRVTDHVQDESQGTGEEEFDEKENTRPSRQPQKRRKKDTRKPVKTTQSKRNVKNDVNIRLQSSKTGKESYESREDSLRDLKGEFMETEKPEGGQSDDDYTDDFEDQGDIEELRAEGTAHMAEHVDDEAEEKEPFEEEGASSEEDSYGEDEWESEESIPEEMEDDTDVDEEIQEEVDEFGAGDDRDSDDYMEDDGPTEEELVEKLQAKHGNKGRTIGGDPLSKISGEIESEASIEKEQNLNHVQSKDLRRRKKPPKEKQNK